MEENVDICLFFPKKNILDFRRTLKVEKLRILLLLNYQSMVLYG